MLKQRLSASRRENLADLHHPWRRISVWLTLILFVVTVMLIITLCVGGQINEPVWPAPSALQLAHLI